MSEEVSIVSFPTFKLKSGRLKLHRKLANDFDYVERGCPILEFESNFLVFEVNAEVSGFIKWYKNEGDIIKSNEYIALITKVKSINIKKYIQSLEESLLIEEIGIESKSRKSKKKLTSENKHKWKEYLARAKVRKVIKELLDFSLSQMNLELRNEVIIQSARLELIYNNEKNGAISIEEIIRQKNQIINILLKVIDEIE